MQPSVYRANAYKILSELFKYPDKRLTELSSTIFDTFSNLSPKFETLVNTLVTRLEHENTLKDLQIEYSRLFVGPYQVEAAPFSSVYLDPQGLVMGESTIDAIEYYVDAGLNPNDDNKEPPDHISTELEFMYYLIFNSVVKNDTSKETISKKFLTNHLSKWTGEFAKKLLKKSKDDFYSNLGTLLNSFISEEVIFYSGDKV